MTTLTAKELSQEYLKSILHYNPDTGIFIWLINGRRNRIGAVGVTLIARELSNFIKLEYLESMEASELAFWLINSFTPERYRAGDSDVVEQVCKLLYYKSNNSLIIVEFFDRLWGMHGIEPDYMPWLMENVVNFRRK